MCCFLACCFFFFYVNNGILFFFFFQAEDGIRDLCVTGVQTCALPILSQPSRWGSPYRECTIRRCRRRSSPHSAAGRAHGDASLAQTALAAAVAGTTFLILFLALIAAMFDRRFALLAEREAAALRVSEERFRSLYRRTPLPLHSLDGDGRIEHVSDAWLDLLGYRREEAKGRPLTEFMTEASAGRRM